MPIHVLGSKEQLEKWAEEFIEGKVFVVIVTKDGELILEPRKSTRPLDFGYCRFASKEEAIKSAEELKGKYKIKVVEEDALSWDVEKSPFIRVSME